jgi:hypothetical protein
MEAWKLEAEPWDSWRHGDNVVCARRCMPRVVSGTMILFAELLTIVKVPSASTVASEVAAATSARRISCDTTAYSCEELATRLR